MGKVKDIASQLLKSRDVKVVQIDKDLKPGAVDQRLREITTDAKKKSASKKVMIIRIII